MITMQEPIWGYNTLVFLNEYMEYHETLFWVVPITADIFVFFYPVLLVVLYIVGMFKKTIAQQIYYKESALWIFLAGILSALFNVFIQFFFVKFRPNDVLGLVDSNTDTMLHRYLPSSSFPSDHSAMGIAIAMGLLLWGYRYNDKKFKYLGFLFLLFGLLMGVSRVMICVHWPTDVIAGFAVGILVPVVLFQKSIYKIIKKIFIGLIINFQQWVWKLFGVKY